LKIEFVCPNAELRKKLMQEDPLYAKEKLSDDEVEAAEYFGLL